MVPQPKSVRLEAGASWGNLVFTQIGVTSIHRNWVSLTQEKIYMHDKMIMKTDIICPWHMQDYGEASVICTHAYAHKGVRKRKNKEEIYNNSLKTLAIHC